LNYQNTVKIKIKDKEMVKEEVGKKEKRIKSLKKEIDQWNHGIDKFQSQIDEQEEEHKKKKF